MSSDTPSSPGFDASNHRLRGVYGKLNRARDHINSLDKWFEDWIDTEPWGTAQDRDGHGLVKRTYFVIKDQPPTWTSLCIGDAIHNLRTALDHLTGAVAVKNGKTVNGVYFPIAESADLLPAAIQDKISKCPESFRTFVEDFKPYYGGNNILYALHRLDIIDKHRLLVPVAIGADVWISSPSGFLGAIDFSKIDHPVKIKSLKSGQAIKDGDTIVDFLSHAAGFPEKTKIETKVALSVVFGDEAETARNMDVREFLGAAFEAVEGIVRDAEPLFLR